MLGVIFDMDGTLIDSTAIIPVLVQKVASGYGITLSAPELKETTHYPFNVWVANWNKTRNLSIDVQEVIQKYAVLERKYLENHSVLSPGVDVLLKELHEHHVKLGIATSAPRARLDNILNVSSVGHFFTATVSIDEVQFAKPNPEPYLKVAHALNLSPSQCVGIEDTITGIKSVKSANMKAVALRNNGLSEPDANVADMRVHSFSELSYAKIERLIQS